MNFTDPLFSSASLPIMVVQKMSTMSSRHLLTDILNKDVYLNFLAARELYVNLTATRDCGLDELEVAQGVAFHALHVRHQNFLMVNYLISVLEKSAMFQ